MLDDVIGVAGVVHRQPGSPLGVPHHRGPKLGILREKGFIGGPGEQCDEIVGSDWSSNLPPAVGYWRDVYAPWP